jgi:Rho-binding antiterminator
MSVVSQDQVGRCSLIDVLEEAVLVARPVAVRLRSGETFLDTVADVVTEGGDDFAVFRSHGRVAVGQIEALTRAEAEPPSRLT